MNKEIIFTAQVYKVQTLVDGGIRVTLDLPEDAVGIAAALMECQRWGVPILATVKVADEETGKKKGKTV